MRISEALSRTHNQHKLLTNEPLVIEFSSRAALDVFLWAIEEDIDAPSGELTSVAKRNSLEWPMYDGIELRVRPLGPPKTGVHFWAETAAA